MIGMLLLLVVSSACGLPDEDEYQEERAEKEYHEEMVKVLEKTGNSSARIGRNLEYFDPSDEGWKEEIKSDVKIIKEAAKEFRKLDPPEKHKRSYELLIKAMNNYDEAYSALMTTIESGDPGAEERVSKKIKKAGEYITRGADQYVREME